MSSQTPEFEKKILRDVLEQLKDPAETSRKRALARQVIFGVGSFGLVVSFFLAINAISHPLLAAFLAAGSGCVIGFGLYLDFAHKQWPITREHINLESVKKRLKELET